MYLHTDQGGYAPGWALVALPGGINVSGTSNFIVDPNANCLAGIQGQYPQTSIALPISVGTETVTPASMANIAVGSVLQIDASLSNAENVTVMGITSTTSQPILQMLIMPVQR